MTEGNVDCTSVTRGIWLVKVPKYLSVDWQNGRDGAELGRLRITKPTTPEQKPGIVFVSSEFATTSGTEPSQKPGVSGKGDIPKEHKFVTSVLANQTLAILKEAESEVDVGPTKKRKLSVEGRVIQKAECRPAASQSYMNLKKSQISATNKPIYQVTLMDKAEVKYKPIDRHVHHKEDDKNRKDGVKKSMKLDKDVVLDKVFQAFEKHQYYTIKDLCAITGQPYSYLKDILNEVCVYNMSPPHKYVWELKPEYRHYRD